MVLLYICGELHQTWLLITFSIIWKQKWFLTILKYFSIPSLLKSPIFHTFLFPSKAQNSKILVSLAVGLIIIDLIRFILLVCFPKHTFYSFLHNFLFEVEHAFRHSVVLFPNPEEHEHRVDKEGEKQHQTGHLRPRDSQLRPGHFHSLHAKISLLCIMYCIHLFLATFGNLVTI